MNSSMIIKSSFLGFALFLDDEQGSRTHIIIRLTSPAFKAGSFESAQPTTHVAHIAAHKRLTPHRSICPIMSPPRLFSYVASGLSPRTPRVRSASAQVARRHYLSRKPQPLPKTIRFVAAGFLTEQKSARLAPSRFCSSLLCVLPFAIRNLKERLGFRSALQSDSAEQVLGWNCAFSFPPKVSKLSLLASLELTFGKMPSLPRNRSQGSPALGIRKGEGNCKDTAKGGAVY